MSTKSKYKVKTVTGAPATDVLQKDDHVEISDGGKTIKVIHDTTTTTWTTTAVKSNDKITGSIANTTDTFEMDFSNNDQKIAGTVSSPSSDPTAPHTGTWTADEDGGGGGEG